ncbi:MAG: cytochrome c oxidase subunit II [Candidatus Limnocylindria bacterium]
MRPTAARTRLRTILRAGAPLLLIGVLGGCMLPPEPRTEAAQDVFNLYLLLLGLAALVFVGVEGFIVYAIVRYRRREGDDTLPPQLHGNNLVEIIWTAIPTVIVLILFVFSVITLNTVEARSDEPGVVIEVDGFQWNWTFRYSDDVSVQPGTVENPPVLAVPVGEPVRLRLNAIDVIHSFYVPQFLIKRDMVPVGENGNPNELEFTITEEGTYAGQCAEFCGAQHADMTFVVDAMPREEYDAWFAAAESGETPPPAEGGDTVIEISADALAFDTDSFEVPANEPFQIVFTNLEALPHDVAIDVDGERVFDGENITGPDATVTYSVPALPPGEHDFLCTIHPIDMVGTVIATE